MGSNMDMCDELRFSINILGPWSGQKFILKNQVCMSKQSEGEVGTRVAFDCMTNLEYVSDFVASKQVRSFG